MKECSKCSAKYYDDSLEFCLEDGSKLVFSKTLANSDLKTAVLGKFSIQPPLNFVESKTEPIQELEADRFLNIKEKVTDRGFKVIEIAPIVIALIHNYWQWLYLNRTSYNDTISFLTSAHFVVWLILLVFGVIITFIALKYGKNKGFANAGLIILAINLLLSMVPTK